MKHLFIVNPAAGKGRAINIVPKIHALFENMDEPYFIELTKGNGDATEIARRYTSTDDYRVYSVGGDGTLNEVLNGMIDSNSSLADLPLGSGNDFIKSICKNGYGDDILEKTVFGTEQFIDVGKINDRYFLNISSAGLDGVITQNAHRFKKLPLFPSHLAYLASILVTLWTYKSTVLDITIDDKTIQQKSLMLTIGNGQYYGGGMNVLPYADISDGLFEICLVNHVSRFTILRLFPQLMKGNHVNEKYSHFISFYKGNKITLNSTDNFTMNIDGEILCNNTATFDIIEKKLKFVIPQ